MPRKTNPKLLAISITALACMALAFTVHWSFIIAAAILSIWGWRVLYAK